MFRHLLLILLLALVLSCSTNPGVTPLEAVFELATNAVSESHLLASVTALSSIHTRFMHWDPGNAATVTWLMETLVEQGCPAEADSFSYHRIRWIHTANVVSRFPGRTRPEEVIVVGAHWDSIDYPVSNAQDSSTRAPGTIDNASGVAAVMELARILPNIPLERSVKLVFFANEELGMHGSRRERDRWRPGATSDSLVCMVNVDMLGWDADRPDASIICDTLSASLAASLLPAVREATFFLEVDTLLPPPSNPGSSDHLQFWYYALPAIWLHEGPDDLFPHANTDADSLSELDAAFLTDGTRALVAAVLQLAGPITD